MLCFFFSFFFFNDTATTEIYTLSLHDALPICLHAATWGHGAGPGHEAFGARVEAAEVTTPMGFTSARPSAVFGADRKSTRLNSSHSQISYAVFCLKKKKKSHKRYVSIKLNRQQ